MGQKTLESVSVGSPLSEIFRHPLTEYSILNEWIASKSCDHTLLACHEKSLICDDLFNYRGSEVAPCRQPAPTAATIINGLASAAGGTSIPRTLITMGGLFPPYAGHY